MTSLAKGRVALGISLVVGAVLTLSAPWISAVAQIPELASRRRMLWVVASVAVVLAIYHFGVGRWSRFSPSAKA